MSEMKVTLDAKEAILAGKPPVMKKKRDGKYRINCDSFRIDLVRSHTVKITFRQGGLDVFTLEPVFCGPEGSVTINDLKIKTYLEVITN